MENGAKNPKESTESKVFNYIKGHAVLKKDDTLVVAVSGGPDSVCLLGILAGLKEELGINLHVAHLDHELRGEESDGDARYVSRLAEHFNLPYTVEKRDVEAWRIEHGGTLEEAAREVRYTFLAEIAESLGTDKVATGHTRDDNIETILLHLVRGTGTRGLRGLQPETLLKSDSGTIRIVRPLLDISRNETVDYCREKGLEPRQDSSNLSLSPLRNRIRQQLVPLLENYNERFGDAILRTAAAASDELDYLDNAAREVWSTVIQEKSSNTFVIDKNTFSDVPVAIQRHFLRQMIESLIGNLKDIETRHISEILEMTGKPAGKRIDLPGELVFIVEYDRFLLTCKPDGLSPLPELSGEYALMIPGEMRISGWIVIASISGCKETGDAGGNTAYFDLEKTGDKLMVRSRKAADRFQPLGVDGSKKLGEFMIDSKIPQTWRDDVPIVCSPDHIIWVVGYRIDDRVKITAETEKILKLEFKQQS